MAKKWWSTKRATKVVLDPDGESYCTYHDTPVVTWTKDYITLDNGGWDTLTTRARIHDCMLEYDLKFNIYRDKGQTTVVMPTGHVCDKRRKKYLMNESDKTVVRFKRRKRAPKLPTNCDDCTMKLLADVGEGRGQYDY
jgi:hypothetical protein